MHKGRCKKCHAFKNVYSDGMCESCAAQKAGKELGDRLIKYFSKKLKLFFSKIKK